METSRAVERWVAPGFTPAARKLKLSFKIDDGELTVKNTVVDIFIGDNNVASERWI